MTCTCMHDDIQCNNSIDYKVIFDGTPTELEWCKGCVETVPTEHVVHLEVVGDL